MKNRCLLLVLAVIMLSGCNFIKKYQLGNAIVKVGNYALYESDILQVTQSAVSAEDSATMADNFIRQWATEVLLYEKAKSETTDKKSIEDMIEDYRRSLYVNNFQDQLLQNVVLSVDTDSVLTFFEMHSERFTLNENLLKGLFLVIPIDAPEQADLQDWLRNLSDENLEKIEKYAYQIASGYEFFTDQWQSQSRIIMRMPISTANFNQIVKTQNLIISTDSINNYLLRVTDKQLSGSIMPFEYVKPEIERIIITQKQVEYLNGYKHNLYEQALKNGDIKISVQDKSVPIEEEQTDSLSVEIVEDTVLVADTLLQ